MITDVTAFTVLSVVPFENVSVLGRITALGLVCLLFCYSVFFLPILSYFPGSPKIAAPASLKSKEGFFEKWITKMGVVLVEETRIRWVIVSFVGVALIPIPLYVGYVGYAMGMIILICFLVSFVLSPFIWSITKPRFLFRGLEEKGT